MLVWRSNYEDAHRYYHGTFVQNTDLHPNAFFKVSVGSNSINFKNSKLNINKTYQLNEAPDKTLPALGGFPLNYILPSKKVYQNLKHAFILYRVPAKQYHRGISSMNTQIFQLSKTGELATLMFDMELLENYAVKENYHNTSEIALNPEAKESWALDSAFSVTSGGVLFLYTTQVGFVNWAKKSVIVNPLVFGEILQLFPDFRVHDLMNTRKRG